MYRKIIGGVVIGVVIGIIFGTMLGLVVHKRPIVYETTDTIYVPVKYMLSQDTVYQMLKNEKVLFAEVALRQSILETGNYKSRVCLEYNNLFGFCNGAGYMKFSSPIECIRWYKDWQQTQYDSVKYKDYYKFLDEYGYATDTLYTSKLKRIKIDVQSRN